MRAVVATGRPTPELLNAFTKLPDFQVDVNATQEALKAFKIQPTAAQALLGITKIQKKGDRLFIRTKGTLTLPVVVDGKVKGWAKLSDPVSLRIRPDKKGVAIDQLRGIEVGPWQSFTVDLAHVNKADWQPGAKSSSLAISASFWIFSSTFTLALPNPTPPPAPSRSSGLVSHLPGN
jgi:hypothetical protein